MHLPDRVTDELPASLSFQLFRNLLDNTSDSIYFKDIDSRFLRISRRQAERYGLASPEQAVGKTDADFFAPAHAEAAREDEQRIIASGQPVIGKEEQQTWPDGHRTWVSTSKMPLRDGAGRVIGTFGISRDITQRKEAESALQKSEENLRVAFQAMERELDRARLIQRALLPPPPREHPFLEIAVHYEPLEAIGGDYYAIHALDENRLGMFVGDVMGHGVSAALFMALLKFLSDGLFRVEGGEPKAFLEKLNMLLMDQMPMSFATGVYGMFERTGAPGEVELLLAGAGHPAPLVCRSSGQVESVQAAGNAALGLTDQFATEPRRMKLHSGDLVLFYTDGVTEASNERDEMLGGTRLIDIACSCRRGQIADTMEDLMEALRQFRGAAPLDDDILLVGVRVR